MSNTLINYIEFRASDLAKVKSFYSQAFGWEFTDYGTKYTAFSNAGLDGGFELSDAPKSTDVLVVLYHKDLEAIMETVKKYGGAITLDIFSFPGGRRFQFTDPCGNELAVWSE